MESFSLFYLAHHYEVRCFREGSIRLWVAKDVGYAIGNKRAYKEQARFEDYEIWHKRLRVETFQSPQKHVMLTDAGLYRLLYSGRSEQVKEIRRQLFLLMNPEFAQTAGKKPSSDSGSDNDTEFDPVKKLELAVSNLGLT